MKKKKRGVRPLFDSIRKPTAPPAQKFASEKTLEKTRPSRRKAKHKKTETTDE